MRVAVSWFELSGVLASAGNAGTARGIGTALAQGAKMATAAGLASGVGAATTTPRTAGSTKQMADRQGQTYFVDRSGKDLFLDREANFIAFEHQPGAFFGYWRLLRPTNT